MTIRLVITDAIPRNKWTFIKINKERLVDRAVKGASYIFKKKSKLPQTLVDKTDDIRVLCADKWEALRTYNRNTCELHSSPERVRLFKNTVQIN